MSNHFKISLIKSIVRLVGCLASIILSIISLPNIALGILGGTFLGAEVLGIFEEEVEEGGNKI